MVNPTPPFRPDLSLVGKRYRKAMIGYHGRSPEPVQDLRPLVLDEIVKGEHTPDWDFYGPDSICEPSNALHKFYIWTCRCGKQGDIDTQDDAWTKFMIHKYGDEWAEKVKFDKLWDECFPPSPKVTSFIRSVLSMLVNLSSGLKRVPPPVWLMLLYVGFVVFIAIGLSIR